MSRLLRWWFYRSGWKVEGKFPDDFSKCVVCAAPHTSNWDFLYGIATIDILGLHFKYAIKKEWTDSLLGPLLKRSGAIGIDRKKGEVARQGEKISAVDAMVNLFDDYEELYLLLTPEGTRSAVDRLKTGFYRVALQAKVPIVLCYIDYGKKVTGIGPVFEPTGNMENDLETIEQFFSTKIGKHPHKGIGFNRRRKKGDKKSKAKELIMHN
ncbi:1-acyl-sn-glycerol-3-phosphate acyltransferase [Xanthovirga aplysinae]|uniref:1-acyl-sn-glycerol-3-phosphate acyltransferase n=1 Tax=Xanthovirga aplysinae TaxID=2529853 RepID=UPI0012BD157A|nr:1-acyl-sn-glycerol-3-phosphate acyltransferase [Xanthovirga aplysinae]MTI31910.1 glycerol acyltransferase [Xanthovirga aplysinae]